MKTRSDNETNEIALKDMFQSLEDRDGFVRNVYILKNSGRLLSEHRNLSLPEIDDQQSTYKIWDLQSKEATKLLPMFIGPYDASFRSPKEKYIHCALDQLPEFYRRYESKFTSHDNNQFIFATQLDEELEKNFILPKEKFMIYAEDQLPEIYEKLRYGAYETHLTSCDKNVFIVANQQDDKSDGKVVFDIYENKKGRLIKLATLQDNGSSSLFKRSTAYTSNNFQQVFAMSQDVICILTTDHIDFWKKNASHFDLLWSCQFSTQHDIRHLFKNYELYCLATISDHELLCQAIPVVKLHEDHSKYPCLLFKVNLKNRKIETVITLPQKMTYSTDEYARAFRIDSTNIFIVRPFYSRDWMVLDADTIGVLTTLQVGYDSKFAGVTAQNDLVVFGNHTISILEIPKLKAYLSLVNAEKSKILKENTKPLVPGGCEDTDQVIREYVGSDFLCQTPREAKWSDNYARFYKQGFSQAAKSNLQIKTETRDLNRTMRKVK